MRTIWIRIFFESIPEDILKIAGQDLFFHNNNKSLHHDIIVLHLFFVVII